jgi:hypothetical protein
LTNREWARLPTALTIAAAASARINQSRRTFARILGASMAIVIDHRFRGPDGSGNGGYSAGLFAQASGLDGDIEVTLRLPPPLDTPLTIDGEGNVRDGDALVAEVRAADVGVSAPDPVAWGDALAAEVPDLASPFPNCFVCGHARGPEALHIHAGPVQGRTVVAATWTARADTVGPEFVWAALDCPGAYATGATGRGAIVLARIAARVIRVPQAGEQCVVVGRHLDSDGRKHAVVTAVFTAEGELLGLARALWIEPRG